MTTNLFKRGVLDWLMAKSKSRKRQPVEVILATLESIHAQLHDLDQKVDYLIQNLRHYNGDHVHHNARLSDFMD